MIKRLMIWLCLFGATATVFSQDVEPSDVRAKRTQALEHTRADGIKMSYRLYVPTDYDPAKHYPLILALHGAGQRGAENLSQLLVIPEEWVSDEWQAGHPCLILVPQCPWGKRAEGRQWVSVPYSQGSYTLADVPLSPWMGQVRAIFDEILEKYAVDRNRIYVVGGSMGGYGTWDFIMRFPDLVAAAIPMCGAGDPSMAAKIKDVPVWAFHGDADRLVPPSGSIDMITAMKEAGAQDARITIYKGAGHNLGGNSPLATPEVIAWLMGQQKIKP